MRAVIVSGLIPLQPQGPIRPRTYLPVLSELAAFASVNKLPTVERLGPTLQAKKRNLPPLLRIMTGEEVLPGWAWSDVSKAKKTGQCALCQAKHLAGKVPWGTYFAHEICVVRCLTPPDKPRMMCDRCHSGYKYKLEAIGLCGRCRYV